MEILFEQISAFDIPQMYSNQDSIAVSQQVVVHTTR
jgi:hypothetical protein